MADESPDDAETERPDDISESGGAKRTVEDVLVSTTMEVVSQIDERWFLYPAYLLTLTAGAFAIQFSAGSREWSAGPVALAWTLLFVWYWLYGVAFRYRRPALKYFSLAAAAVLGGLLTAFSVDRALPQFAATETGAAVRGVSLELLWAAAATGSGLVLVVAHAILFSRFRGS